MSLRVGLVGVGQHARWSILPALRDSDRCKLTAACDLNRDNLDAIGDTDVACFTDLKQMLDAGGFDVVYVATLEDSHRSIVIASLEAGYHVMCEKPLGMTADECQQMLDAEERSPGRLAVGFEKRYHADQRKIREWIEAGLLGTVEAVHFQEMWDAHKTYTKLSKRRADHIDRSGCLDCGIHCLDLTRYLTGGGQWASISARGRWFGETERKQAPHIAFMGDLDNGVLGTLNSSYAYCTNIPPTRKCFSLAVVGDRGCVNWASDGDRELSLTLITADGTETFAFEPMPHFTAIRLMMNDFASFLGGDRDWPAELATGRDGLIAQQAVDEALRQTHTYDARKTQASKS